MATVKAIIIDPFTRTVREEQIMDSLNGIYKAGKFECMCSGPVMPNEDIIYVDDEGLLKPGLKVFEWRGYPNPLVGIGVMLGTDQRRDSCDVKTTLEEVKAHVIWTDLETK